MKSLGKPCRMLQVIMAGGCHAHGAITHLTYIVQVAILDAGHLAIHAVLHRHARRVMRVSKGAHACQIHAGLHKHDTSHSMLRICAQALSLS